MWLEEIAVKRSVSCNFNKGAMVRPLHGLVLHIQQGTEAGTYSWFNQSRAKVSAHFGNPKLGSAIRSWAIWSSLWTSTTRHGRR